ncbi:MAG TPA: hypothetical protein PLD20_30920 [Blastocatellia bacterium]|nr:hypothetical protein [Blastocatellia bacterium]HMY74439.1 hypothetical protein [Blastocatellia bacterium]HMZ22384.1 hypothetical protein [Blastocatellia bacterium]HNG34061.1 hypothetical protein [Blastocatellia bacterium]
MILDGIIKQQAEDAAQAVVLLIQLYQQQPDSKHQQDVLRILTLILDDLTETRQMTNR